MLKRQTSGSIVCPGCNRLVGVMDEKCFTCGRANPGLWGWAPVLQKLGRDLGATQIVMGGCILLYLAMLLFDVQGIRREGLFSLLSPSTKSALVFGDADMAEGDEQYQIQRGVADERGDGDAEPAVVEQVGGLRREDPWEGEHPEVQRAR